MPVPLPTDATAALRQWLYDASDERGLIEDLTRLLTDGYLQRLRELGQIAGIRAGALDSDVEEWLAARAVFAAASIVKTHNADLIAFAGRLAPEQDASAVLRTFELARADWKSRQISYTETMSARNQADADFRAENDVTVRMRVVPEEAVCPICQGYVGKGYMEADEADAIELPAHVNCQHGWAYATGLVPILADKQTLWLGSPVSRTEAA